MRDFAYEDVPEGEDDKVASMNARQIGQRVAAMEKAAGSKGLGKTLRYIKSLIKKSPNAAVDDIVMPGWVSKKLQEHLVRGVITPEQLQEFRRVAQAGGSPGALSHFLKRDPGFMRRFAAKGMQVAGQAPDDLARGLASSIPAEHTKGIMAQLGGGALSDRQVAKQLGDLVRGRSQLQKTLMKAPSGRPFKYLSAT